MPLVKLVGSPGYPDQQDPSAAISVTPAMRVDFGFEN